MSKAPKHYNISRDTLNAYPLRISDTSFIQDMTYDRYGDIRKVSSNSFSYEILLRDKNSLILKKEEIVNNISIIYDYTYDDKQRLIEVKRNNTTIEQYTYDDNSNRINSIVNNIQASSSYTLDDQIEVYANNTYTYDEDGYLKQKVTPINTTNYTYLELGELKEVSILSNTNNATENKTITYKHNASNQRIAKLVNGVITHKYLWKNLTQLLAIYDKDDKLIQRYDYASLRMPVSMLYNGDKYYLHYDQVGSLRIVSNSSHDIVKEITYDSFGNILSDSNSSFYIAFRYAGGLYDEDTKLSRFGYRDYDSYTAKWTAKDPIDFSGGDSNLYSYVMNNPINGFDANGLWTFGISFNISAGTGVGGTTGINFVFDGHGNVDIQAIRGVGGYAGAGFGVSMNGEWSNADCIEQLKGYGYQYGANYGTGIFYEAGTFGGSGYKGYYAGGGIGAGLTPGGFGFYGTNTVSVSKK